MNGARYSYLRRICKLVEDGADIVIVSEDYAAPMFDDFRIKHPERFLSVGIAEQNGITVACGLALAGKYPIVYGCAPFPLTRAIDQVKSAVAGMHLPMTILNSGVGFGVPEFGATHYNADDIAMVRGIPGVKIITPTDNIFGEQVADFALKYEGPIYMRFDKNCEGVLYATEEVSFSRGFNILSHPGEDVSVVIISCGYMLHDMLLLAKKLERRGILTKVIDLHSLPFDECGLLDEIAVSPVVTVEEHIPQGGIGSVLLETMNRHGRNNPLICKGIDFKDSYPYESGSRDYFIKRYNLTLDDIELALGKVIKE